MPNDRGVRFIQFNHPWDPTDKTKSYGLSKYRRSYGRLRDAAAPYVRAIEVINGPGLKNERGLPARVRGESAYNLYLTRGFRIGPTADQDNHYRTWGSLTDARTGVLAAELTPDSLSEALLQRRFYATTDRNLRVWFGVEGAVMGSEAGAASRTLTVRYRVEDADEPGADYTVSVVHGSPAIPDSAAASKIAAERGDHTGAVQWTTTHDVLFVYLKVVQWPRTASERDDAMTSPVWINVSR